MGEMPVWILPYRPKVVKPAMSILDREEPLMYTDTTGMGKSNKK